MLEGKDREREDEDIGMLLAGGRYRYGVHRAALCLGIMQRVGHSSKEKERYKKHNEGGCVSPLAFCPELSHTQIHKSKNPSAFYFPHESPSTKEKKVSSKTTTLMSSVFLPLSFLRCNNDQLLQCL